MDLGAEDITADENFSGKTHKRLDPSHVLKMDWFVEAAYSKLVIIICPNPKKNLNINLTKDPEIIQ